MIIIVHYNVSKYICMIEYVACQLWTNWNNLVPHSYCTNSRQVNTLAITIHTFFPTVEASLSTPGSSWGSTWCSIGGSWGSSSDGEGLWGCDLVSSKVWNLLRMLFTKVEHEAICYRNILHFSLYYRNILLHSYIKLLSHLFKTKPCSLSCDRYNRPLFWERFYFWKHNLCPWFSKTQSNLLSKN